MKRGAPLNRDPAKAQAWRERSKPLERGKPLQRKAAPKRRKAISPASEPQREKVRLAGSIVSSREPCEPAHVWPRSMGGCDSPDCVVPLTRDEHDLYERGELDLLPHLVERGCWREMAHVIEEHKVSPALLARHLSGYALDGEDAA